METVTRRTFLTSGTAYLSLPIGLSAAALFPPSVCGQVSSSGTYRIGFLSPGPAPHLSDPLISELRKLGWIGERAVVPEFRHTHGDPRRAETLARELVELRVRVIITNVTTTAMAARRVTSTVPIVMQTSGFPVEGGLAESLARPGGNVTGMTIYAGGGPLFGKYVQLLQELVPSLERLGVLWGYAPPGYRKEQVAPATDELARAARALNINMRFWQTGTEGDLATALASAGNLPLDALFITGGTIHGLPGIRPKIAEFILRHRLPTLTDFAGPFFVGGGALAAYSADPTELAVRTARFVDQILRGAKPGDLPIEQPTRYGLYLNLKNAKALGFSIPPSLLARADQVIE